MMNLKKISLFFFVVLFLIPTGVLCGGTVFLKNGHVVTGKVIASDEEKVVLTWSNGRATIYRRFIDSVVLDSAETEYLARRVQLETPGEPVAVRVNEDIELPDLGELLDLSELNSTVVEVVNTDLDLEITETDSELDSEISEVAILEEIEEAPLPEFSRVELEGLGLSVDVPSGWESVNAMDAGRIMSGDGSIMIALDRYPVANLAPEEAALILGERLENAGFLSKTSGRSVLFSALHPAFVNESLSPAGTQDCLHGLIANENDILLVSVYTPIEVDSRVDGLIASVLTSLESPVGAE